MGVGFRRKGMGGTRTQQMRWQLRWWAVAGPLCAGNAIVWNAGGWLRWLGVALIAASGPGLARYFHDGYRRGVHDALQGGPPPCATATRIPGLPHEAIVYHHAADGTIRGRVGHIDGVFVEPVVMRDGEGLSIGIDNPGDVMPLDVQIRVMPPDPRAPENGGDEGKA
jgi:hypothetical protein